MNIKNLFRDIFLYKEPQDTYDFSLPESGSGIENANNITEDSKMSTQNIYTNLNVNIDYVKGK